MQTKPMQDEPISPAKKSHTMKKVLIVALCSMIIVGAIVSIALKLFPSPYSQNAAMATCKNFHTYSEDYVSSLSAGEKVHYWKNGTTDFGGMHPDWINITKSGFHFFYLSNSNNTHEATKFIFGAYPAKWKKSRKVFLIDETDNLYYAIMKDESDIAYFKEVFLLKSSDINWEGKWNGNNGYTRLVEAGKNFKRK